MQLCGFTSLAIAAVTLAACQASPVDPQDPTPTSHQELKRPRTEPYLDLSRVLVDAAPADWDRTWPTIRSAGPDAVPGLLRALAENPHGTGAQAAVHLLGQLRGDAARAWLLKTATNPLTTTNAVATEATLALGNFSSEPGTTAALQQLVTDAETQITTRAAAAAALIRQGQGKSVAPFVEAVFLAASPNAQPSSRKHRIAASKSRWAHERYMLIEALRAQFDGEDFGLDEDASWPALRAATAKMIARLTAAK